MKKPNIDEYILQNYKIKTNAEMASELGCNPSTISNHRKKLGISATELNQKLREQTDYICSQCGKKTKTALAKELNCSASFIKKIWTENHLANQKTTIYFCDETYFEKIDTPQKAYFLGFLAADGNLYRRESHQGLISLGLKDTDIEILQFFKQELKTEKPIQKQQDKRRENTVIATLQITSDKLFNQLLNLGIGIRKTFDLSIKEICNKIPQKFISAFIHGYFDGDGSINVPVEGISKSHVRIAGPLKNLNDFQIVLKDFGVNGSILQDKRRYSQPFGSIEFKNTTEKYLFLKFIYGLKVKCLTRKESIANDLMQRIESNTTNRSENIKAVNLYKSVVQKWEELLER